MNNVCLSLLLSFLNLSTLFRCQQLVKREHWIMDNLQAFIVKKFLGSLLHTKVNEWNFI